MLPRLVLPLIVVLLAAGGHAAEPSVICGFDDAASVLGWALDPGVRADVVPDHATQGAGALKLALPAPVGGLSLPGLSPADWSGYVALEADVYNPENRDLSLTVRLTDASGKVAEHTQLMLALVAERFSFPLAGADLDRARIARVWVGVKAGVGPVTLFLDNLRLTPEKLVAKVGNAAPTVFEAEDFSRGNVMINPSGWGPRGGPSPIIQNAPQGPTWAEYDLEFEAAGRYRLDCKYASADPRPLSVYLDGALLDPDALGGTTGSFEGITARWDRVAVLPVPAGRHTLRLDLPRSALPHIDAWRLTPTDAPADVPAMTGRSEAVRLMLASNRRLFASIPGRRQASLCGDLDRLASDLAALPRRAASLAELRKGVEGVAAGGERLCLTAMAAVTARAFGVQGRLDYAVGVDCPARKVMRAVSAFRGEVGVPVRVSLARGEYEGAQIVVLAGASSLRGVTVKGADLLGPHGARLSARDIEVHPVGYVEATSRPQLDDATGTWCPDPLLVNGPFGVETRTAQPVWLTVHVPETAAPGEYRGFVSVTPGNAPSLRVPLVVRVWDFAVPAENHLKTTFFQWPARDKVSREEFHQWMDFVLRYRLGIMDVGWGWDQGGNGGPRFPIRRAGDGYDYSQMDEDLQFCFDRHMNSASMADFAAGPYSPEYTAELHKFLADYARHLREKGWFHRFYLKLQDEPGAGAFAAVKSQGELVKSIDPTIKRLCTVPLVPQLIGAVDLWCPLTPSYNEKLAADARARGEEVWTYTCCGPAPPWPNIAMVYQDAVGSRILPWQCWRLGAPGYLYWGVKFWPDENTTAKNWQWSAWSWAQGSKVKLVPAPEVGPGWPRLAWVAALGGLPPGDGYVTYPGPHGEPLSSVRLEAFRDGIEDVEYLWLLRQRADAARRAGHAQTAARCDRLLAQAAAMISPTGRYDTDPAGLLDLRERMGRELSSH
jgi:hypothetical protein